MPRVEVPGLAKAKAWNGYKGYAVIPEVAHLLRTMGVPVHKRPYDDKQPSHFCAGGRLDDGSAYYWIAPAPLALLAQASERVRCLVRIRVLVWAMLTFEIEALDSMLRLAVDATAYREQIDELYEKSMKGQGDTDEAQDQ